MLVVPASRKPYLVGEPLCRQPDGVTIVEYAADDLRGEEAEPQDPAEIRARDPRLGGKVAHRPVATVHDHCPVPVSLREKAMQAAIGHGPALVFGPVDNEPDVPAGAPEPGGDGKGEGRSVALRPLSRSGPGRSLLQENPQGRGE